MAAAANCLPSTWQRPERIRLATCRWPAGKATVVLGSEAGGRLMAKRRGSTITAEAHVDEYVEAEVRSDELDDEDLMVFVDEAKRRGLLGGTTVGSRRERMVDVYQALVANRHRGILEKFERALFPQEEDQHL